MKNINQIKEQVERDFRIIKLQVEGYEKYKIQQRSFRIFWSDIIFDLPSRTLYCINIKETNIKLEKIKEQELEKRLLREKWKPINNE